MGNQQLLLLALGTIIVAIAIGVGITQFGDSAVASNKDGITQDLAALASKAQLYYRKPVEMGGGGGSYTGITANAAGLKKLIQTPTDQNGTMAVETAGDANSVTFSHTSSRERGSDGNPIVAECWVGKATSGLDSMYIHFTNE